MTDPEEILATHQERLQAAWAMEMRRAMSTCHCETCRLEAEGDAPMPTPLERMKAMLRG
jgi:hypothetical protein